MAYTSAITYLGPQPVVGFRETGADVDVSGTAAGGTGISLDVSTDGPSDGTTYDAPYEVRWVVRDEPTCGMENLRVHWDKDNDNTTNGTVRLQIDDLGIAANGLANLELRVFITFRTLATGGVS